MEKLNYRELVFDPKENSWDKDSKSLLKSLFALWGNTQRLIVCHPNAIFKNKPVSREIKDFDSIDWRDVNDKITCGPDQSYTSIFMGGNDTFKYIFKRLKHEIGQSDHPRHLAVAETDSSGELFVRCIFRATKEKLEVAESPIYERYKPKSSFDLGRRIGKN